jgi:hypothetical protein
METIRGDILDTETLLPLNSGSNVVLNLATAIPHEGSDASWEMNDRIRRESTRNLVDAAIQGRARILLFIVDKHPESILDTVDLL